MLLEGRDVIGQAQTGTGKTAAFGLPMLQSVDPTDPDVQALVLTPTRELCIQVTQALRTYGAHRGINPVAVFGGASIRDQQAYLKQGAPIVVGTVGRVLDLISRHSLMLHSCRYVVLDEADEMLDLGFLEDVEKILSYTPNGRQTALFSATMPGADPRARRAPPVRPGDDQGQGGDADDRHGRAVLPGDEGAGQGRRAGARAGGRAADAGDRLRAHEDPHRAALPHAARQGHERQGAARRHEPGLARRRDDLVQGRPRCRSSSPPTSPPAGSTSPPSPTSSTSTCRRRRTSTCTGSAAPAASGARAARSRSSSRASGATSRRSRSTPARRSRRGRRARTWRRRR